MSQEILDALAKASAAIHHATRVAAEAGREDIANECRNAGVAILIGIGAVRKPQAVVS